MRLAVAMAGLRHGGRGAGQGMAGWATLGAFEAEYARGLVEALGGLGHEVVGISAAMPQPAGAAEGGDDARDWRNRPRSYRWPGAWARRARRAMEGGEFDGSISLSTAVPAMVVVAWAGTVRERLRRVAAAAPPHVGPWVKAQVSCWQPRALAALRRERRALGDRCVGRVVAMNAYVRRQLVEGCGVAAGRVAVVPCPRPAFTDAGAEAREGWRGELRERLGIAADEVVYLFHSYRPQLDGLETLLAAFKKVADGGAKASLFLTGLTEWRHERRLMELGLRGRVRFLGQPRNVEAVYAAADVTVQPTYFDPAGEAVMQSLAMGVPVITTGYSGAAQLLLGPGGERWGRVVAEPGDVGGLAEAMGQLARRPAEREDRPPLSGPTMAEHAAQLLEVLQAVRGERAGR